MSATCASTPQELPDKKARLKTLADEKVGLEKQMPVAVSEEEEKVRIELQQLRQSLTIAQQGVSICKLSIQKVDDLDARLTSFQIQMAKFYADIVPALTELGVPAEEMEAFRPKFSGDIHLPLGAAKKQLNTIALAKIGGEPPAEGTINWIKAKILALTDKETADKARQDKIKQIQTRVNAYCHLTL